MVVFGVDVGLDSWWTAVAGWTGPGCLERAFSRSRGLGARRILGWEIRVIGIMCDHYGTDVMIPRQVQRKVVLQKWQSSLFLDRWAESWDFLFALSSQHQSF